MDGNQVIAVAMLFTVLVVVGAYIVFTPRHRRWGRSPARPAARLPGDQDQADLAEAMESVRRALVLVQQRYAALVRLYDETQTRLHETEVERDHWKRQALNGRKH